MRALLVCTHAYVNTRPGLESACPARLERDEGASEWLSSFVASWNLTKSEHSHLQVSAHPRRITLELGAATRTGGPSVLCRAYPQLPEGRREGAAPTPNIQFPLTEWLSGRLMTLYEASVSFDSAHCASLPVGAALPPALGLRSWLRLPLVPAKRHLGSRSGQEGCQTPPTVHHRCFRCHCCQPVRIAAAGSPHCSTCGT